MITIDDKTRSAAMLISGILFRAFFLGFGLLILSCIPILLLDEIYALHSNLIDIPRPEWNALFFGFLGQMKVMVLVIFLVPAIAIRWALRESAIASNAND